MAAPHTSDIDEAKRLARRAARDAVAGLDAGAAGAKLAEHVIRGVALPPRQVVAGFLALPGEIDISPLLLLLLGLGHSVVLPVTPRRGLPLTFRVWEPSAPATRTRFGTVLPTGEERTPDVLLVPLVAFDRTGRRLGHGAGYYDRTLALLPGRMTIGCAFAAQELDAVPAGPYDVPLDMIATDAGVIDCR